MGIVQKKMEHLLTVVSESKLYVTSEENIYIQ